MIQDGIYQMENIPDVLSKRLKDDYNIYAENINKFIVLFR